MEKILTVVIPTYNMEKYLDRCLSSLVVEPDWMDRLEVLVVNDGSKDRSSAIAHGYESKYPRTFKVIDKENGNYGSCINAALPVASGKYIKILDADDWFENANVPAFIDFLNESDVDWVISHTYDRNARNEVKSEIKFQSLPDAECNLSTFSEYDMGYLFMHSITYRLDRLREMEYKQLEHISYTDLQWATEPLTNVGKGICFHKVIYNYFVGREGQTVEASAHCRNMWMEEKVILHIVETIERKKKSLTIDQKDFVQKRVGEMIKKVYNYYLHEHVNQLDEQELCSFDEKMEALSPQLYVMSGESVLSGFFFRFHYVKDWRKNKSRKTLKFKLFDTYCRLRLMMK